MTDNESFCETTERDLECLTAEELLEIDRFELDDIFSKGTLPESSELEGDFGGYPLAGVGSEYIPDFAKSFLAMYVKSPLFIWKGKTFSTNEDGEHGGKNVFLSKNMPVKLFVFTTSVEPSEFDSNDCLSLNYEHKKNPFPIRQIRDELRQVNSNLFLGRANVKLGSDCKFITYFCLER